MTPFVTRLSEDASEVGSENDERWATDSDYGLSERQLQEAAANKRSAGAANTSKQTGTAPMTDSFWAALLAGLPFLSELTSCTSPCFVADSNCKNPNDLSRLPSQDNAQCVSSAEEVIKRSSSPSMHGSSSPSMLGRPPSTHFASLIVERDSDVKGLHEKGEPSTFYIGEDAERHSSDPAMLGMVVQSQDAVCDSIAPSLRQKDSTAQLAASRDPEQLEMPAKSEDAVHAPAARSLRLEDLKGHLAMSCEPDKPEAKNEDVVCDSVAPSIKQGDSKAGFAMGGEPEKLRMISKSQETAVQMDKYYYREPDVEEPEPESEDWVE